MGTATNQNNPSGTSITQGSMAQSARGSRQALFQEPQAPSLSGLALSARGSRTMLLQDSRETILGGVARVPPLATATASTISPDCTVMLSARGSGQTLPHDQLPSCSSLLYVQGNIPDRVTPVRQIMREVSVPLFHQQATPCPPSGPALPVP